MISKLNKKNLLVGGIALLLTGAGLYLILKGAKPKDTTPDQDPVPPKPPIPSGGYSKFRVETLSSNLNVRQSPTTSSGIVTSLPKGTVINAKPSGTSGWYEYSENGTTATGYVSSLYIKPVA